MSHLARWASLAALAASTLVAGAARGGEAKDVFDYKAQKAAPDSATKIVFIADKSPHGPEGNHEFVAGAIYLARAINAQYPNAYAVVHTQDQWPDDLSHADAVVILLNHGGAAVNPAVKAAMDRGAGLMAVHYSVEVDKGEQGDAFLKWIGGYFETFWSVNPWWTAAFTKIPEHPTTRGVKPFTIEDEWYYHMRFVPEMKGVTPVLSAVPKLETLQGDKPSERGSNPAVRAEVEAGQPQHLAWAYDRPDGGRGFGFTGFHKYTNLKEDGFRTLLVNAVAWTAKLEIPEGGIPTSTPNDEDLAKLMADKKQFIGQ